MARRARDAKTSADDPKICAADNSPSQADEKKAAVDAELKKLEKLFSALPENERTFLQPLLENAAFMRVTLDELQARIRAEGATDTYQNGANQSGMKISAAIQAYNQLMKTYHTLMDKLLAKLPPEVNTADELDEFRL